MDVSIGCLVLAFCGVVLGVSAQVTPADRLLNQTEASLLELVKQVESNALNSCDLLSTCNAISTCSRLSCPLMDASNTGYECQGVLQNPNCKGNCPWRNFDFSRSFIRVPGVYADKDVTTRQLQEICAQRNLDSFFKTLSNNTNFYRLYFGSVDGTFRIFPGADESDCGSYDPRSRLWYLTSTTVKKAVMVLIDRGSSMANIFPSTSSDSNLARAYNITESFLDTTTKDDYVNIFTFFQTTVEPFSSQPVRVTNTSTHPDFGNFTAKLSAPNQTTVPPGNTSNAILQAIVSPSGLSSAEIPSDYLKVMIVITDKTGVDAISEAPLPWDLIKNNSISLFLYMFPPSDSAIDASTLGKQFCDARGYFSIMDDTTAFGNPLLALEAYYSFLANIHFTYMNSGIDYSTEYLDYSEVDNRTFTLSKAAFDGNGELLGVAAINIFKTKLQNVQGIDGAEIEEAVRNRANRSTNFNASQGINTITCPNQTAKGTCNQTVEANIVRENIVCSSNFKTDTTTLRKLSCCGTCTDKPPNLRLILGLGLGLGIPTLIVLVIAGFCFCKKYKQRQAGTERGGARDPTDHFPGDDPQPGSRRDPTEHFPGDEVQVNGGGYK